MGQTVNFNIFRKNGFLRREGCRRQCARGKWRIRISQDLCILPDIPIHRFSVCLNSCSNSHTCFFGQRVHSTHVIIKTPANLGSELVSNILNLAAASNREFLSNMVTERL